jgi:hypothetical protein
VGELVLRVLASLTVRMCEVQRGSGTLTPASEMLDAIIVSDAIHLNSMTRLTCEYDVRWPFCCKRATSWI